eukprot:CAMPEP_0172177406 /NCGR_PEP_ID=MMETSP1050-20130122/15418_1 /TAXON_ID=233186 /ORGANISM="Cryptomonas curvata, Strain CCAP979/52" /LENGTH=338 /DNA_ID=CAMNT_0012849921 /DNA_START=202 /DNA_END=1216 /DNA_ORIENTATION=-
MGVDDFNKFFDWIESTMPGCSGTKYVPRSCLTYEVAAGYFLNTNQKSAFSGQVDRLRYASEVFYCKYAPAQVASVNISITCGVSGISGPCRLWAAQPYSGRPNWYTAVATASYLGPIYSVSCFDKVKVFRSFLNALFANKWSGADLQAAANKFLTACSADKGGDSYILVVGPSVAVIGAVITTATMFRAFAGPPWPDVGMNLLLLSIILLLVGFWSITVATTDHLAGKYQVCSGLSLPLTTQGRWYDHSPCMDKDTAGNDGWNPFVVQTVALQSTYIAGGVLTFLSVLCFLGLSSGVTEGLMGDRFGKYLVTLQDIPTKIRLPFPPPPEPPSPGTPLP